MVFRVSILILACIVSVTSSARASLCSAMQTALAGLNGTTPLECAITYLVDVDNFVADPSNHFASVSYDFGVSFGRIDSVGIQIVVPTGLNSDYCNTMACHAHWIDFAIVDGYAPNPLSDPSFSWGPLSTPDTLRQAFSYAPAEVPTLRWLWPSSRAILDGDGNIVEFAVGPWPDFLFSGHGIIGMRDHDSWGCYLNSCDSGTALSLETGITSVQLIINGIAIPEPHGLVSSVLFAAAVGMCRRRRAN